MPSFDVAADTRVGVFSIRSIIIRDDFPALFDSSGGAQVYTPASTKQTGPSFSIWGWAANIAAGARPADTRDRLAHGGHRRPRTREEPTRTHEDPSRTQISGDKRGPRQGNRGKPARSRTRGPPSERLRLLSSLATTLAPSYAPQAGQLHELDNSSWSHRQWTGHKQCHLDTPQDGPREGGAISKGGRGIEESYFRDSKSVGEQIRFPRVA